MVNFMHDVLLVLVPCLNLLKLVGPKAYGVGTGTKLAIIFALPRIMIVAVGEVSEEMGV